MRILFVNPVPEENRKVYIGYNHGIGYLSAVAKASGHETALCTISKPADALSRRFKQFDPDVVALTGTSAQWRLASWAADEIARNAPDVPIIAGGVHSTVATLEVITTPGVWAACRGEGEEAFVDMLSGLSFGEWEETRGFWTRPQVISGFGPTPIASADDRRTGEIVRNAPAPLVDITALPHPDRKIYDYQAVLDINRNNVGAEFMASRGCPYDCSYCINPVMSELTAGEWKKVRFREVEDVVSEIEEVTQRWEGVEIVGFHDDIFGLDKEWLAAFADAYRTRIGLPFWCNQRVGSISEDDVEVLKSAGCFRVHMGVESADERLRRDVLGRDISTDEIEEAFAMLKRHGLKTVAFNMIGIPYETEETLQETIALNRRILPDWLLVSIFAPFPGTKLGDLARKNGWVSEVLPESYYDAVPALSQPSITDERLLYYYENFIDLVYDKKRGRRA